jgi:hypothetical protein
VVGRPSVGAQSVGDNQACLTVRQALGACKEARSVGFASDYDGT